MKKTGQAKSGNSVSFEKLFRGPLAPKTDVDYPFREARIEALAANKKPLTAHATASAFAQWVFELYRRPRIRLALIHNTGQIERTDEEISKALGVFGESEIEKFRLWANEKFPGAMSGNWVLDFAGCREEIGYESNGQTTHEIFEASALKVNGQSLRCRPDVVLRHLHTGDVVIIERKVTMVPTNKIPAEGWPNLKAQLWAYSWIDRWRYAPNLYLIGQIWSARVGFRPGTPPKLLEIYPRWKRSDQQMQAHCQRLFKLYGGEVIDKDVLT